MFDTKDFNNIQIGDIVRVIVEDSGLFFPHRVRVCAKDNENKELFYGELEDEITEYGEDYPIEINPDTFCEIVKREGKELWTKLQ